MVENLEEKTGERFYGTIKKAKDKLYNNFDRSYWVDTLTGQAFWPALMTANEIYLQRFTEQFTGEGPLTWDEAGLARLIGVPIALATSKPILNLRDAWQEKVFKVTPETSLLREKMADLALAIPVIAGLYGTQMAAVTDDIKQWATAVAIGGAVQIGMAFTYLPFMKKARKKFRITQQGKREEAT